MDTANNNSLLTLSRMARLLRVPSVWLRAEAVAGRIPCLCAGKQFLFHAPTVIAAITERAAHLKLGGDSEATHA